MNKIYTTKYGATIDLSIIQVIEKECINVVSKATEGELIIAWITIENQRTPIKLKIDSKQCETAIEVITASKEAYNDLIKAWSDYKHHEQVDAMELYMIKGGIIYE